MPQFEQRLFFMAKQHNIPTGKNTMAHSRPKQGYESSKIPIRHAGQPPIIIISGFGCIGGGCTTTLTGVLSKAPYDGT